MGWYIGDNSLIVEHNNDSFAHAPLTQQIAAEVGRAKVEADKAAASAASINAEAGSSAIMRTNGPAIQDAERRAVERASGGQQTVI